MKTKSFLKWVGGKGSLVPELFAHMPFDLPNNGELTYVEPFVGGGAVLFSMLERYPNIAEVIVNDANARLVNAYQMVYECPDELMAELARLQDEYMSLPGIQKKEPNGKRKSSDDWGPKEAYYYERREEYNTMQEHSLRQAALLIFLNKTSFRGLYRENQKRENNTPFGHYDHPKFFNREELLYLSQLLHRTDFTISSGDFAALDMPNDHPERTMVYMDPPYVPLSATSSFCQYNGGGFEVEDQIRLRDFCNELSEQGIRWMQSNSSAPLVSDLYQQYHIHRINALRRIDPKKSGAASADELIITNYYINE